MTLAKSKHFEVRHDLYAHSASVHHSNTGDIVGWVSDDREFIGYMTGYLSSNEIKECRRLIKRISLTGYAEAAEKAIRFQLDEMNHESQG